MDRPVYKIRKSTGGWGGKMRLVVKKPRPSAPSLKKPHRFRSGTMALRETKAFEHIPPNYPMKMKKVKRERVYVPKKEQYAQLAPRNSSRIQSSKQGEQQELAKESSSMEKGKQVLVALTNARKQAKKDIELFNSLLVAVLQDRSLLISPAILASFLVDLSDKKSFFYWEDAETYQLVKTLKGVYAYQSGVKEAVSKVFGEKIAFVEQEWTKKLARFYVAALMEDVMVPVKAIWAPGNAWSTSLGVFLGNVFSRMESLMDDVALSRFLIDSGVVDVVMTGSNYDSKLESHLKQCGVRARSILNKMCREKLVTLLSSTLFKECPSEDMVISSGRNLMIDEPSFTSLIWEAIVVNLQSSGLQLEKRFRRYAQVLAGMERTRVIIQENSMTFLASIKFPSRLNRLNKSVPAFLKDCVECNVLDENAVSRWSTAQGVFRQVTGG